MKEVSQAFIEKRYKKRQLFIKNTHAMWEVIRDCDIRTLDDKTSQTFLFFDYRYERKEEQIKNEKHLNDIEKDTIIAKKSNEEYYEDDDYEDDDFDESEIINPYEKILRTTIENNEMRRDRAEMTFFLYYKELTRDNIKDFLVFLLDLYKVSESPKDKKKCWSYNFNEMKFNAKSDFYESREHIYFTVNDLGNFEGYPVFQVNMDVIASY